MKEKRNRFIISTVSVLFFSSLILSFGFAQSRGIDETSLELEMANRLEVMLEKIVGKERALVKVDLTLSAPKEVGTFISRSVRSSPGVVFPETEPGRKLLSGWEVPNIESINIIVYLDNKLSPEKIEQVRSSVPKWLELDFSRGDSLKIELVPWKEVAPEDVAIKQLSFLKKNLWIIIGIGGIVGLGVILFLILFLPTRKYIKERVKIKPEEKKMPDFETLLNDLKNMLTQPAGMGSSSIDRILEDIRDILAKAPTKTDRILEEVKETLEKISQYQAYLGTQTGVASSAQTGIGGTDFLNTLREIVGGIGGEGGGGISPQVLEALHKIEELMRRQVEAVQAGSKVLDEPFKYLNSLSVKEILLFMEGETSRIAAIILAHIEPQKAAQVLNALAEDKKLEVSLALANLVENQDVAIEIRDFIQRKLPEVKLRADFSPVSGNKALADILSTLSYDLTTSILEKMERINPSLAKAVKSQMFLFEDIAKLSDQAVIEILKMIDLEDLAYALSVASDKVKEKFYKNMSENAKEMLKEEVEVLVSLLGEISSKKIVIFEDIINISPRVIQNIIRSIERNTLKVALKGTSEEIRERFYSLLTERAAAMLKEDIEVMSTISHNLAQEAQKKILETIHRWEKKPFLSQQLILEKIRDLERSGRINLVGVG